ncbi:hypothetical protein B5X24_HaOG214808 [Helicoverpa armigera]|uniref:THIF-type NAD/FAD binding fold domain-containing protein n=1 Tax=Helicoverpa armigera TaxID=29058 RepID=A0A2W1BD56_HELAM|nr:hypothetical protein B5X24_HaOG214808 [Helicoverpa armigera]
MEQLNALENEIKELRKTLMEKEREFEKLRKELFINQTEISPGLQSKETESMVKCGQLPKWAIERYSRQILLRDIGVSGQARICQARVLIVGAGGLGCPAAMYLAAAGVGEIGIIDYDVVEITNIHRQILHYEHDENTSKAESAAATLRSINSRIKVTPYNVQLDSKNALEIAAHYDVILDCTDNVPTRYLLSDLSCLTKLPLISGSALKMEGQLTIYGYRSDTHTLQKSISIRRAAHTGVHVTAACFPRPPRLTRWARAQPHGVAGPVPGLIGTLQAMEAIKCILDVSPRKLLVERMFIFDAEDMTAKTVQLRKRNSMCAACSDSPTITHLVDYEAYCKAPANDKKKQEFRLKSERRKLEKEKRMTGQSYFGFRTQKDGEKTIWIQDVLKSERRLKPCCKSEFCTKSVTRYCNKLTPSDRQKIFEDFWQLEWQDKKKYVRSLIDNVPVKRRRSSHKGIVSRKGDSKIYHLILNDEKVQVCRVTFLNTLGLKEAMVRCWLGTRSKCGNPKSPIKSQNVLQYVDTLPKVGPKCQFCISDNTNIMYIDLNVKNQFQLYNLYVNEMKSKGIKPASRKTFSKVLVKKNLRIFKPKNERDVCDLVKQHNVQSFSFQAEKCDGYYYEIHNLNEQWP